MKDEERDESSNVWEKPLRKANCASLVMASASSNSTNFTDAFALQI